jgi:hypothetical protein
MLFILAMDVLNRLFLKAASSRILQPMEVGAVKFQCSFYADDVILSAAPTVQEARAVKSILNVFSDTSGLQTNLAKCSVTPIFGDESNLSAVQTILGCQITHFPVRYLGLPLSTKAIPKAHLQSLVEKVANKLPAWQGPLMTRSGRLIWVKSVLMAAQIYAMMAEKLPPWVKKEIDAICRKFLWAGKEGDTREVHGCMADSLQTNCFGRIGRP